MKPYLFLTTGQAEDLHVLNCDGDAAARARAEALTAETPGQVRVEVWDERRFVGAAGRPAGRPAPRLVI
jgi:hypothetical protein